MSERAAVRYERCAACPYPRASLRPHPPALLRPPSRAFRVASTLMPSRPAPLVADAVPAVAGASATPSEYAPRLLRSPAPPHRAHCSSCSHRAIGPERIGWLHFNSRARRPEFEEAVAADAPVPRTPLRYIPHLLRSCTLPSACSPHTAVASVMGGRDGQAAQRAY